MPDWNYDFWGRNKYLAGGCPDYDKAVKKFKEAAAKYDALPRKFGMLWGENETKSQRYISDAKKAQSEGKAAKRACETAKKVGEGKYDADTAAMQAGRQMIDTAAAAADPAAAAPAAPVTTVSTDTTQQSGGGSNTMLFVGIGAVVLIGGAAFMLKKGKKKKKVVAAAPVAVAPMAGAKA
jgi:LPXTG-motif cell wall-anchored protein